MWPCQKTRDNKRRRMVCPGSDTVLHLVIPFPAVSSPKLQDRVSGLQQALGSRDRLSPPPLPSSPTRQDGQRQAPRGCGILASSFTPAWQGAQLKFHSQQMCFSGDCIFPACLQVNRANGVRGGGRGSETHLSLL